MATIGRYCVCVVRFGLFGCFAGKCNIAWVMLCFGHSSMFTWRYDKSGLISVELQCRPVSAAVLIVCWLLMYRVVHVK